MTLFLITRTLLCPTVFASRLSVKARVRCQEGLPYNLDDRISCFGCTLLFCRLLRINIVLLTA
jgi:hypothetical protein